MKTSSDVKETMLRFYERLSANDVGSFDALVSADAATLVIGTAPGEWVTDRE
jgi:ketosteroid isomerase-like protein